MVKTVIAGPHQEQRRGPGFCAQGVKLVVAAPGPETVFEEDPINPRAAGVGGTYMVVVAIIIIPGK